MKTYRMDPQTKPPDSEPMRPQEGEGAFEGDDWHNYDLDDEGIR